MIFKGKVAFYNFLRCQTQSASLLGQIKEGDDKIEPTNVASGKCVNRRHSRKQEAGTRIASLAGVPERKKGGHSSICSILSDIVDTIWGKLGSCCST